MGMFDHYVPRPALHCERCGSELAGWQGKDGPCNLVVWQQGEPAPAHHADDAFRLEKEALARLRLPGVFGLYTSCSCKIWVAATGFCRSGVWTETAVGECRDRSSVPATDFGDGLRQCSRCAHVWAIGDVIPLAVCPDCKSLTELAPRDELKLPNDTEDHDTREP